MTYQESKLLRLFRSADERAREDAIRTLELHQVTGTKKAALCEGVHRKLQTEKTKGFLCPVRNK